LFFFSAINVKRSMGHGEDVLTKYVFPVRKANKRLLPAGSIRGGGRVNCGQVRGPAAALMAKVGEGPGGTTLLPHLMDEDFLDGVECG
jgi:hypothetical protein